MGLSNTLTIKLDLETDIWRYSVLFLETFSRCNLSNVSQAEKKFTIDSITNNLSKLVHSGASKLR